MTPKTNSREDITEAPEATPGVVMREGVPTAPDDEANAALNSVFDDWTPLMDRLAW